MPLVTQMASITHEGDNLKPYFTKAKGSKPNLATLKYHRTIIIAISASSCAYKGRDVLLAVNAMRISICRIVLAPKASHREFTNVLVGKLDTGIRPPPFSFDIIKHG
ncbi:hypothetical protein CR513_57410, partial [Mucuna pruriens]